MYIQFIKSRCLYIYIYIYFFKLIYLKTKYSNDDQRFKIDDRFVEHDENDAKSDNKKLKKKKRKSEESESSEDERVNKLHENGGGDDADGDIIPKSNRKQIKSENLNSLKILEQITGKQFVKPPQPDSSENSNEKTKKSTSSSINKMVRYDPTKDEHKKFEIVKEDSSSDEDESPSNKKSKHEKEESAPTNQQAQTKIEEDLTKFYEIEPNIKDLFSSSDVFQFKFTSEEKDESENEDEQKAAPKQKLKDFNQFEMSQNSKKAKYSSSEDDDDDEEEENEQEYYDGEEDEEEYDDEAKKDDLNHKEAYQKKEFKKDEHAKKTQVEVATTFLPDFASNKDIKEGLAYFSKIEKSREEWLKKREVLVKVCLIRIEMFYSLLLLPKIYLDFYFVLFFFSNEYKKKHKRMIRIKKNKENEKLLPWKLTKTSNFKK